MTSTTSKKWLVGSAAGIALGGALVAGLASVASADATATPTSPSTSTTTATSGTTSSTGSDRTTQQGGASQDTAVTGDEATKVSAAVTAKDSAVTVSSARKDADGSYDVLGTKGGQNVFFDVSADLATITQAQAGVGHGGGSADTAVTGDEAAKASAAVTAKDSSVTVSSVRKDPDGSYDVLGTRAGADVFYDVSADLATVTLHS